MARRARDERVQSDLDFEAPEDPVRVEVSASRVGAELLRWLPLAGLLALLAQVGIRGLRPALAESAALDEKERELDAQYADAVEHQRALELRLRAQDDPIYVERMRRLRGHEFLVESDAR